MFSQNPKMPRWEKLTQLISDALQDEEMLQNLRNYSTMEKRNLLIKDYGFTDDDLALIDDDLKKLSDTVLGLRPFWY